VVNVGDEPAAVPAEARGATPLLTSDSRAAGDVLPGAGAAWYRT
jgi:alpha-glucosidase